MARGIGVDLDRRARGAWATPPALVDHVLDSALDPVLRARARPDGLVVFDPACGDGRFLVAAARRIAARFGTGVHEAARWCAGIELDPATAAVARARLGPAASVTTGDALARAWGSVDVVVGNPPFLTPLRRRTRPATQSPGAPYADVATAFWRRAVDAVQPRGGRVGFVLPASVLATRDAAAVRTEVAARARVAALWWAGTSMFDAAVDTCAITVVRGEAQSAIERWHGGAFAPLPAADGRGLDGFATWGHLVADAAGIPPVRLDLGAGIIADVATASADFRQQYYGLVEADAVHDDAAGPPLVTTGLIEPGRCLWSHRPATFARRRFRAPRVDLGALPPPLAAWAERRLVPKVLVATQTRVVEASVDVEGAWLPSVPVISVVPDRLDDLWGIAAVLTAPPVAAHAAATCLGAGLAPGAIKLRARQVAALPLPSRPDAWEEGTSALRAGDVVACARAMAAAYELGEGSASPAEVLEWWVRRSLSGR